MGVADMPTRNYLTPKEIAEATAENAIGKASLPIWKMFLSGILAGAYIAFAGFASGMGSFNLLAAADTYGIGRALCGTIFSGGLMLVVIAGAELFTGNCLMITGVLTGKVHIGGMLKNWLFVYLGNLAGSVLIAWLTGYAGLLGSSANLLGAVTIRIAAAKVALPFGKAVVLGILCNWLVCLAVWMASGAKEIPGKVLAIFFPIWMFVTSGFEHSVANMFYIPAGIFAAANPAYVKAALDLGVSQSGIDALSWGAFFSANLLPVTIGNVIGGGLFVGLAYWLVYLKAPVKEGVRG
jgi:formate/nitrite transporter